MIEGKMMTFLTSDESTGAMGCIEPKGISESIHTITLDEFETSATTLNPVEIDTLFLELSETDQKKFIVECEKQFAQRVSNIRAALLILDLSPFSVFEKIAFDRETLEARCAWKTPRRT